MKKLNNKGFISIYTILWLCVLFPLLLFVSIDVSYYMHQNNRLKSITDNATASAVTYLDETQIPYGKLVIEEVEAKKAIMDIIRKDLSLNDDMTPKSDSVLGAAPKINVQVVNNVPSAGIEVTTPQGNVTIKNSTVLTTVEYPIKGLFYHKTIANFKKLSVSQVQFKK